MTSMWWSIITLTTVGTRPPIGTLHTHKHMQWVHVIPTKPRLTNLAGYGDIVPITPAGRLLGSVGALIGIGLFTLPAGMGYHLLHLHACTCMHARERDATPASSLACLPTPNQASLYRALMSS